MTKADLIRTILERCETQVEPPPAGRTRLATRSPAAGGGLSGARPAGGKRATLRDPQTGNKLTLSRRAARRRRV